jgi:hypothetical protein
MLFKKLSHSRIESLLLPEYSEKMLLFVKELDGGRVGFRPGQADPQHVPAQSTP